MERNINLEIANDVIQQGDCEKDEFIIDDDKKAEWALRKIAEERAEAQRYVNVCKSMILDYEEKIRKEEEKLSKKTSYLEFKLQQYFQSVEHKSTKTQKTYKLPSGTLRLKNQQAEFKRDEEKIINWLKENKLLNFIKVKEKPDWVELKRKIKVSGDRAVSEDGQIIDGIEVIEKPPVFEVEI
ncbi:host-nuclease inhibitor Gam family protein [Herbivorax sp. ANBcel31]|uniref:host-nuclease inhibitor Gam family protein n=1 Tax=Herbivorax sp. ANBcel31 TaxID=3069754 RepID=UPI0027AE186A|nr:host-nuclease inhibitor Gam family protein [Herbivorax sp. ANBcel31]MDQ2087182.1 host-nuclease inhibitor Gam family protein [Herbivorax sp. ANBcel31]